MFMFKKKVIKPLLYRMLIPESDLHFACNRSTAPPVQILAGHS